MIFPNHQLDLNRIATTTAISEITQQWIMTRRRLSSKTVLPKNFKHRRQIMGFLDINEKGEYVLPFSRRVIYTPDRSWLNQNHEQLSPSDPSLSNSKTCETKQQSKDENKVSSPYLIRPVDRTTDNDASDDKASNEQDDDDDDDNNYDCINQLDRSYEPSMSSSGLTEQWFPCGNPYDSYDLEC